MKDFFVSLVDFFFEDFNNKNNYSLKHLLILILKIIIFLSILAIVLYFLLNDEELITISN
mgnify:CR=1 FL=1